MITIKVKIENDRIVHQKLEQIMALVDDLARTVDTLKTDTTAALGNIKTELQNLIAAQADPAALTAGVVKAIADMNDLDTAIKAADPGPQPTPPETPATI